MQKIISEYIQLAKKMLRIRTFAMLVLFLLIFHISLNGENYSYFLLFQLIILATWYIHATCVNDLADFKIDQVNLKGYSERPLANNLTSKKQLALLSICAAGVSLTAGSMLGLVVFLVMPGFLLLNIAYSSPPIQISHRGVFAPLLLPLGYVFLPWFLVYGPEIQQISKESVLLLTGMYLAFVGRIVLKDLRDVKGDAQYGKRTFVVRYGVRATTVFSLVFWLAGATILAYLCVLLGQLAAVVAVGICSVAIGWVLYSIAHEAVITRQVKLVAVVGRAANTACLVVLFVVSADHSTNSSLQQAWVGAVAVAILTVFGLYSAKTILE